MLLLSLILWFGNPEPMNVSLGDPIQDAKTRSRLFQNHHWREATTTGFRYLCKSTVCSVIPMTEDALGTELSKMIASHQDMIVYQFGASVFSEDHEHEDRLWFSVSRGRLENPLRKPEETWLFNVDLASGSLLFKTKLKTPSENVRIREGRLSMISCTICRDHGVVFSPDAFTDSMSVGSIVT